MFFAAESITDDLRPGAFADVGEVGVVDFFGALADCDAIANGSVSAIGILAGRTGRASEVTEPSRVPAGELRAMRAVP
jgi:hypothetical protein